MTNIHAYQYDKNYVFGSYLDILYVSNIHFFNVSCVVEGHGHHQFEFLYMIESIINP